MLRDEKCLDNECICRYDCCDDNECSEGGECIDNNCVFNQCGDCSSPCSDWQHELGYYFFEVKTTCDDDICAVCEWDDYCDSLQQEAVNDVEDYILETCGISMSCRVGSASVKDKGCWLGHGRKLQDSTGECERDVTCSVDCSYDVNCD